MGDEREAATVNFRNQLERERSAGLQGRADIAAKQARIVAALAARRSGKPTPRPLKDAARDRRIFRAIKASLDEGDTVRLAARSGPPVTDFRSQRKRTRFQVGSQTYCSFWTPHWEHASDTLRALAWGLAMHEQGGQAFTAHISEEVRRRAAASPKGYARFLQDEIARHLRRAFARAGKAAPDFFFSIEAGARTEPHLHGAIGVVQGSGEQRLARKALLDALGPFEVPGKAVRFTVMNDSVGWVRYISKWRASTRLMLGDENVVGASQGIRRAGKAWYERARRTQEDIKASS